MPHSSCDTSSYLTPYDTGAVCEPIPWSVPSRLALQRVSAATRVVDEDRFGRVDFEDDTSATVANVRVVPDPQRPGCYLVEVTSCLDSNCLRVTLIDPSGTSSVPHV